MITSNIYKNGVDTGEGYQGTQHLQFAAARAIELAGDEICKIQKSGSRCSLEACVTDEGEILILIRVVGSHKISCCFRIKTNDQ